MTEEATCAWGMKPAQIREWNARAEGCGFATVEQQERLARIYDALYGALQGEGFSMEADLVTAFERSTRSHSGAWHLNQDAHRVAFNYAGSLGAHWYADGRFEWINPANLMVPDEMTEILASALGKIA